MKKYWVVLIGLMVIGGLSTSVQAVVDLNTASVSELQALPGIGPGLAQAIIDYREVNGPFQTARELTDVPRIGEQTFERLKDMITAGSSGNSRSTEPVSNETAQPGMAYTPIAKPTPTPEPLLEDIMMQLEGEPAIRDVQQAAIRYAEIDPVRFAQWRQKVKERGLWPDRIQFVVGHDTDDDEDYARSKTVGFSSGAAYVGPDDETWGWDTDNDWDYEFRMRWNLQDYCFHNDMLKVSAETEDAVKLRQKILEEVTKLYFDRKRLRIEMILYPEAPVSIKMKRHLQLEEITAAIDGFTGGYFSDALKQSQP